MSSKTEYEWNIDHMTVEAFKKYHKGRCEFSPLFDNCWLLWCTPNTWDNDGMFVTGLRLFAIPHNIGKIKFTVVMNIKPNIFYHENVYNATRTQLIKAFLQINTNLKMCDIIAKCIDSNVSIHCKIEIIGIWNKDLQQVETQQWSKYGVSI
eukprot:356992_1